MTDFIVLIRSNGNGDPVKNGPHGHWVEVTDNPNPVPVNQLTAGGQFPHADCGEACVKSILASRGKPEAIVTIEHDSHAGSAGTTAAGVRAALADFGVATTQTNSYPGKDTIPFRVVMNPLGGRVVHGEQAAYKAAYDGVTIVCAVPVVVEKPAAPKPAPKPVAKPAPKPVAPKPAAPVAPKPEPAAPAPVVEAPEPVVVAPVAEDSGQIAKEAAQTEGEPAQDEQLTGILPPVDIPEGA